MQIRITEVDREVVSFDRAIPPACDVDAGSTVSFRSSGGIRRQLAEGASHQPIDLDIAIDRAWAV